MNIIKKIIHFLSFLCYGIIIVYALVCIPFLIGYKPLVVLSGSMEPTFKTGSVIYYKHVLEEDIKVGDVITFKMGDSLVSHRVKSIENKMYETKGDANNASDATRISYSDIVGKDAKISIPYLGFYVKYINDHMYILAFIVLILVLEFLFSNFNSKDKKRSKDEFNE